MEQGWDGEPGRGFLSSLPLCLCPEEQGEAGKGIPEFGVQALQCLQSLWMRTSPGAVQRSPSRWDKG